MKNSLIAFNDGKENFFGEYLEKAVGLYKSAGFGFSTVEILSPSDDLGFRKAFERLIDRSDSLVVIGEGASFDLKSVVSQMTNVALSENDNASSFLHAVKKSTGIDYDDYNAVIPIEATLIPNILGPYQGFMIDNPDFTLAVLPCELNQFLLSSDKYFIPYLENKYALSQKRMTLKYMGSERKLKEVLERAKELSGGDFEYSYSEKFGDFKIDIRYSENGTTNSPSIRYVVEKLGEDIYAEYDVCLSQRLFDLLKLKKLTLSVAESFTGGRVVSELIKNPGASEVIKEGVVTYSNESKMDRLGVEKAKLISEGAVSSAVAYQMATGLIRTGVDVAISTTGIAGPKSDDTLKPVGLCYVAVGLKDGVHTYKLNLNGDRERITETAKNTAMFLAIKNLKKI